MNASSKSIFLIIFSVTTAVNAVYDPAKTGLIAIGGVTAAWTGYQVCKLLEPIYQPSKQSAQPDPNAKKDYQTLLADNNKLYSEKVTKLEDLKKRIDSANDVPTLKDIVLSVIDIDRDDYTNRQKMIPAKQDQNKTLPSLVRIERCNNIVIGSLLASLTYISYKQLTK